MKRRLLLTPILCLLLLACGASDFTKRLTGILDKPAALLDSVESSGLITHDQRLKYGDDIGNWVSDGIVMGKSIDACANNPCRLDAVDNFQIRFWATFQSGRWGANAPEKLKNVRRAMEGVILAARAYYGFIAKDGPQNVGPVPAPNPEKQLRDKLNELKEALKP